MYFSTLLPKEVYETVREEGCWEQEEAWQFTTKMSLEAISVIDQVYEDGSSEKIMFWAF